MAYIIKDLAGNIVRFKNGKIVTEQFASFDDAGAMLDKMTDEDRQEFHIEEI